MRQVEDVFVPETCSTFFFRLLRKDMASFLKFPSSLPVPPCREIFRSCEGEYTSALRFFTSKMWEKKTMRGSSSHTPEQCCSIFFFGVCVPSLPIKRRRRRRALHKRSRSRQVQLFAQVSARDRRCVYLVVKDGLVR